MSSDKWTSVGKIILRQQNLDEVIVIGRKENDNGHMQTTSDFAGSDKAHTMLAKGIEEKIMPILTGEKDSYAVAKYAAEALGRIALQYGIEGFLCPEGKGDRNFLWELRMFFNKHKRKFIIEDTERVYSPPEET